MPNEVKLGDSHPLTENNYPIKVGGEVSALEIAKNSAKINGDLTVTGEIKGKTDIQLDDDITCDDIVCDAITPNTISTSIIIGNGGILSDFADFKIDAVGDITLDAGGGEIYLEDDGTKFGEFTTAGSKTGLRLYEAAGATDDDYFQIICGTNGAATLQTTDTAGTDGHITLTADGDIILASATGSFIAKKGATEFSVANSAYAGMILGYTTVGIDAADDSYTLTTSFAVTDSAHKVKFIAPPSGVVEILVSVYADLNRRTVFLGLSDNATYNALDVTHEHSVSLPGASNDVEIRHSWVITGLTAGTAYEYWLGAKSSHNLSNTLRWGGDVSGEYAPFIMKATALPTAVADFAVYG